MCAHVTSCRNLQVGIESSINDWRMRNRSMNYGTRYEYEYQVRTRTTVRVDLRVCYKQLRLYSAASLKTNAND